MAGNRKVARRVRLLALAMLAVLVPFPAPEAAAFNTGQSVTSFFECTDINWQNCATGNDLATVNLTKTGPTSNEESSRYGFHFPAKAVAADGSFDLHTDYGYKSRQIVENSAGQWVQPDVVAQNTTALFGLRIDLDGAPPNQPQGASPFFVPNTSNTSQYFSTGLTAPDAVGGDFDNDGDDDIAVLLQGTPQVQIRRLQGGNWLNYTSYATTTGVPYLIKASDLNVDGKMDAVILTTSGTASYLFALVQLPWGGMRMEGPLTVITGGSFSPQDFDVGDLTGDGRPDVAVAYSNRTVYWLNQGGGNNLDFWSANTLSIKLQSFLYANAPSVVAPAPAPCNATVASANLDGRIYVYWQNNFTLIATLTAHGTSVNALSWSANCTYLASASSDRTVLVWRTSNWTVAANLTDHAGLVYSVAFSPDNSRLASGAADSRILVWNLSSLPPVVDYNVSVDNGTVFALAYAPDGGYLVAGTGNNTVRVYSAADYSVVANLASHSFPVHALAFAPNSSELASGGFDDKVSIWDMVALTKVKDISNATADINAVAYAPNGTRFVAASSDGHVRHYRTADWTLLDDITEGSSFVYGTGFDRTGEFIFSGGSNNYLRLWDRSTLVSQNRLYTGQEFSALSVATSSDGRAAVASEDGTFAILQLSNGSVTRLFRAHDGAMTRVAWSPDAAYLATAGVDGQVHVFETATWTYAANLTHGGNVTGLDFAGSGTVLAASNFTGAIRAWTVPGFTLINTMQATTNINAVAMDPAGDTVAAAGTDGTVRLFSVASATQSGALAAAGNQKAVDWSPDGTLIAAGGADRRARSWWTSNNTLNTNVTVHSSDITAVAFSPESSRFATGGWDARIFVFNRTGAVVQQYPSSPAGATLITSVAWSSDGKQLAAGWHAVRFPSTRVNACTSGICGSQISTYGIAIGNADSNAGNDIILVGNYKSFGPDSAVFRLPFSGGAPGTFYAVTQVGNNAVADAYRVAIGDLTGDGRNDLAIVADTTQTATVYMIAADFAQTSGFDRANILSLPIGASANEVMIADVTDDGHNDVVMAVGTGSNGIQVAYWESTARLTGTLQFANISKLSAPAVTDAPLGFAVGNFNNDTLRDVASANGAAQSVWIYLQKDQLYGTFISQPLEDATFVGDPIVSATVWWTDWNIVPGVTNFSVWLTVDNGFSWTPLQENATVDLNGTNSTQMKYRVEFWSDRAGITSWLTGITIDYVVQTTPQSLSMDILRDFQPQDGECYWPGVALGDFHCTFSGSIINQYVLDNWNLQDANGSIYMPIRIRWQRPGSVTLSNLSLPFNRDSSAPELVLPAPDTFVDATPTFVLRAADGDSDNLRYHIQVATDSTFATVVRSFSQNDTAACWGLPFYVAGVDATCITPDAARLNNGQTYCWRAAAFDGLQWSFWSGTSCFTVDDLAPDGLATSPPYSTSETFTVSWAATDPAGGAGLAANPYDVQFKDGVTGDWIDFMTATPLGSANFVGQNGHTYCFRMRAIDGAGNPQLFTVGTTGDTCTTIDTDKPTAAIQALPPFQTSRNFEVSWSGADGLSGSGIGGFDVQVQPEGGSFTTWLTGYASTSAIYGAPDDRLYTFKVAARDRAGNLGPTSNTSSTRVDTTPPTCTVAVTQATITSLEEIATSMSCTDLQTAVSAYEYCVGESPASCDELLPTRSNAAVQLIGGLHLGNGGTYFVSVHGLNGAGGWSAFVASGAVRVVIPGPASHIDYEAGVWTAESVNVSFGAADALGYTIVAGELQYRRAAFRYNQLGDWQDWLTVIVDPSDASYLFEGRDIIIRGYAYEFRFRARNEVGSWGDHATGATLYMNQLPVAAGGPDRVTNVSQIVFLDGSASLDYDGERDTLTYQWTVDDGRAIPAGPTAQVAFDTPGTHRATLTVSDGHEESVVVVVIEVLPAPPTQILPGFEIPALLGALIAVAALAGGRRRRGGN